MGGGLFGSISQINSYVAPSYWPMVTVTNPHCDHLTLWISVSAMGGEESSAGVQSHPVGDLREANLPFNSWRVVLSKMVRKKTDRRCHLNLSQWERQDDGGACVLVHLRQGPLLECSAWDFCIAQSSLCLLNKRLLLWGPSPNPHQ